MNKDRTQVHKEALQALDENNGIGTLNIETGLGKSKIVIDFLFNKLKTGDTVLILVPVTKLINNWVDEFEKWTCCHYDFSSQCITMVIRNGNIKIYLETVQTAYKWTDKSYTLTVYDEIHTMVTEEYHQAIKIESTFKIGLTATTDVVGRTDKREIYNTYCPIIYSYHNGEDHGILNKTKLTIIDHELTNNFRCAITFKGQIFYKGEAEQYEYLNKRVKEGEKLMILEGSTGFFEDAAKWLWKKEGNETQMKASAKYLRAVTARKTFLLNLESTSAIAKKLVSNILKEDPVNKVLIFSELVTQAQTICPNVVFGKQIDAEGDELIRQFNEGEIRELGSCYSLTLGMNLVGANNAVIESYISSSTKVIQRMGRLHRLDSEDTANIYIINLVGTQAETWFSAMTSQLDLTDATVIKSTELLK